MQILAPLDPPGMCFIVNSDPVQILNLQLGVSERRKHLLFLCSFDTVLPDPSLEGCGVKQFMRAPP